MIASHDIEVVMKGLLLTLTLSALSIAAAAPAAAECIDDEVYSGWYLQTLGAQQMAPDGPLVLTAYYEGSPDSVTDSFVEVTVTDAEGVEVPGTLEVFRPEARPRLVWRPDAPLEAGQELDLTLMTDFFEDGTRVIVVEELVPPDVRVFDLNRREIETAAQRRCCDVDPSVDFCDDPCGSGCERCAIEAYIYPILANFRAELTYSGQNDLYVVDFEVLQTDQTPFESTSRRVEYATRESFTLFANEVPDDAEGFCVSYTVRNDLTDEAVGGDVVCSSDVPLSQASRNQPDTLDTSVCAGDFVSVIDQDGTVERVPLDGSGGGSGGGAGGDGAKGEVGGCATGGGTPGLALIALALVGLAVRRRVAA